jgi:hypothetical protein
MLLVTILAISVGAVVSAGALVPAQSVPSGWTMSLTITTVLDPAELPAGTNFAQRPPTTAYLTCYAVPKTAVGQQVQTSAVIAGIKIPFGGATRGTSFDVRFDQETTVPITVEDATNVAYVDCYLDGISPSFQMTDSDATVVIRGTLVTPKVQRVLFTPEPLNQRVTVAYHYDVLFPPPVPVLLPNFTG